MIARSYAGKSGAERTEDRRAAFVAAGRRIWCERGLPALTVRGVCTEARLADRYFYAEFGNLDGLCVAVAEDVGNQLHLAMLTAGAAGRTTEERLRLGLAGFLQSIVDEPTILAIVNGSAASRQLAEVRRKAYEDVARAIVDVLNPDESTPTASALRAAAFCVGGVTVLIEQWFADRSTRSPEQLAAEAVALCSPVLGI